MNPYWVPTTTRFPFSLLLDNETWFIGARSKLDPLFPDVFHFGTSASPKCLLCHCANLQFTIVESELKEYEDLFLGGQTPPTVLFSRVHNKVIQELVLRDSSACANGCSEMSKGKLVAIRAEDFKPPSSVIVGNPSERAQTAADLAFASGESTSFVKQLAKVISGSGENSYNISLYCEAVEVSPSASVNKPKASVQALKTFVVETIASNPLIATASLDLCEKIVFEAAQTRMRSSILFSHSEIRHMVRHVVGKSYYSEMDLPTMMKSLTINSPSLEGRGIGAPVGHVSQIPDFKPLFLEPLAFRIWDSDTLNLQDKTTSPEPSYKFTFGLRKAVYLQLVTSNMVAACRAKPRLRINSSWFTPEPGDVSLITNAAEILVLQTESSVAAHKINLKVRFQLTQRPLRFRWNTLKGQQQTITWHFPSVDGFEDIKASILQFLNETEDLQGQTPEVWFYVDHLKQIAAEVPGADISAPESTPVEFLKHPTVEKVVAFSFLGAWNQDARFSNDLQFANEIAATVGLLQDVMNGEKIQKDDWSHDFVERVQSQVLHGGYSFGDILRRTWALYETMHPPQAGSSLPLKITEDLKKSADKIVTKLVRKLRAQAAV